MTSDLGQICIQVHPQRAPELDVGALRQEAETIARTVDGIRGIGFSEGDDDGPYLNIIFAAESPTSSWKRLRTLLLDSAQFGASLKNSCLCMCTGQDGWNDYLLLYHFDPDVTVDESDA